MRLLRPLVVGALALAFVAGCGSDEGDDRSAPDLTTPTSADSPTSPPAAGVTTVAPTADPSDPATPSAPTPSGTVTLPPPPSSIDAAGAPTGEGAVDFAACVADGDCSDRPFPNVAWPGADLTDKDFGYTQLTGADLRGIYAPLGRFPNAELSGALLVGANLSGANLSGADLSGADLSYANLSGADLYGTDLEAAIVVETDFTDVLLCDTTMPDGSTSNDSCRG